MDEIVDLLKSDKPPIAVPCPLNETRRAAVICSWEVQTSGVGMQSQPTRANNYV